ncbi:uncharacterized protein LOC116246188 [Nymphaea colorata]|nr:uncharacterized protein LOC116246188 [Nymphaea colorata]XP_031473785.1 uncharacterized protein LOC116246188 [Nymphaea colorata]XP_031473786.1 uncharacterized protein LOC116246188 [Nymphaea colorata]XP_031473788.1 uncharacterized protein LOC116246188 [Nymphaea colorata]
MAAAVTTGSSPNEEQGDGGTNPRPQLSCTKCFDALWFCYSPVYQMKQYYRYGVFDNCSDKWNALFDCFQLKTKRSSEVQEILESREKSKPHIWSYRTPEEASVHWKELFGNVNDP